ncbi:MoaD/ThiS family protein [Plantactinospora siamensis]|uniref:MoaD/ThiS family protein n=1 Tax=Plantactinospora siamensis TaxID=555372 RepID=A0ABV6P3K5_9ACTN
MIRVVLPAHLKNLARVSGEVRLEVVGGDSGAGPVTQRAVLDALEARYPVLLGTMRDRGTGKRRPLVRFYACEEDLSNDPPDTPLPDRVVAGAEPFIILGAMAGG